MLARVDVQVAATNFKISSVDVYNYNTKGTLAPTAANWSATPKVATVPGTSTLTKGPLNYIGGAISSDGKSCVAEIYLFEAENLNGAVPKAPFDRTCLVVGGLYDAEGNGFSDNTTTYYYRADFSYESSGTEVFLDVLRNHHYTFNITDVSGPGYGSSVDAFYGGKIEFTVTVTPWGENIEVPLPFPERSSNCFIATPGGEDVLIPVYNQIFWAYQDGGLDWNWMKSAMTLGAEIVWAENNNTIQSLTLEKTEYNKRALLKVTTGSAEGNAVVGIFNDLNGNSAKDAGEDYLWSWHIWVLNNAPGEVTATDGMKWMDRNLGAFRTIAQGWAGAVGTIGDPVIGLYYQWGRKDGFPKTNTFYGPAGTQASIDLTDKTVNTLANSVAHPLRFITTWTGSAGSASWDPTGTNKSAFDPCPEGWRIPILPTYPPSNYNTYSGNVMTYIPTGEVLPPCRARWEDDAQIADGNGLPYGIYNFGNGTNSRLSWNLWGSTWEINTSYNNRAGTVRCVRGN
jgi:hypothetical protein